MADFPVLIVEELQMVSVLERGYHGGVPRQY